MILMCYGVYIWEIRKRVEKKTIVPVSTRMGLIKLVCQDRDMLAYDNIW